LRHPGTALTTGTLTRAPADVSANRVTLWERHAIVAAVRIVVRRRAVGIPPMARRMTDDERLNANNS
jgi:hypothetical protein